MALAMPWVGSGRFVPDRVWSCSRHDDPRYHECDCSHCPVGEWECDECADAAWVDQFNDDGSVKTRELHATEAWMLDEMTERIKSNSALVAALTRMPLGNGNEFVWQEDLAIPIVTAA